jgi:nucleotide-binding universal stress UspA family protein
LTTNTVVFEDHVMVYLQKILLTTDLSEFSLAAMDHASTFGLLYASEVSILYVAEPAGHLGTKGAEGTEPATQRAIEEATRVLAKFVEKNVNPDTRLQQVVRIGNPASEICKFAAQNHVDLVVMATHGRTGLKHVLLGSVAEKVVRMSAAPVLTVKPRVVREHVIAVEDVEHDLHLR